MSQKKNHIRITLPAFPLQNRGDSSTLHRHMDAIDQLWQELAQADYELYSQLPLEHFAALRAKRKLSECGERSKQAVEQRKVYRTKYRECCSRLGYDPTKKEQDLSILRLLQHRKIMAASDLDPSRVRQIRNSYQMRFHRWKTDSVIWRGGPLKSGFGDRTSLIFFPREKQTLEDLQSNHVKGLWLQQALDDELKSAMRGFSRLPELPKLLEVHLGSDWSYPTVRLVVDFERLYDLPLDDDIPLHLVVLQRTVRKYELVIVLKADGQALMDDLLAGEGGNVGAGNWDYSGRGTSASIRSGRQEGVQNFV